MKALSRASYQLHHDLAKELSGDQAYGYRTMNTYSVVFDTDKTNKKRKPVKSDIAWIHQQHVRSFEQMGTTETTAQVTPPLFTQTLVDAAVKTGRVEVKVGQGVSEVLFEDQKAVGVELKNGETLHGDHVVVCMGPWSGQLKLKQKIPVHGSHVHSIVLKPEDPTIPNQAIFTAILDHGTTAEPEVYPRPDGTVYLCGAADKEPLPESADLVKVDQEAIDLLIRQASIVSPQLTNVPLLKSQACYLPISSKTDMPLIGPHPAYPHLFLATGHSCWGILNAPITGKIVAEWLMDGQVSCLSPQEISFFVPE
ncbi:FAD dependent oxidoreductase [Gilbertella persicaria]|uniref:FAD dependent oxidoreductase n=1 Tax=Gilbertella persicaria TaxID=101096 RepID=UPI002220DEDF|nr:FAD dependent oxidoreductase [Gilbertella persicaria]KAI8091136.1 FAD dependent oxidoreductase [Gilbertella persicaria]